MAVVEYMHHVYLGDHRRHIPGFIKNPGAWHNPSDETFVGWTPTNPDFYVPDSLTVLSKEDVVQRCIAIHAIQPIMVMSEPGDDDPGTLVELTTEAEVRAHAEEWYDAFVTMNLAEEAGD
jgi:hypothetical protein